MRVKSVISYKRPAFWIIIISVIACIAVAIFFLTDPKEKTQDISWPTLEEIREGYSQKDATADGCVVFDGHTLLAGEKQWINFVNETNSGKSSAVRIYQSYSDQENVYYVKELSYDCEKYHLKFYDRTGDTNEEFLSESSYTYLVRSPYSTEDTLTDCYLLADSSEVTAKGFWNSILSSTIKPEHQIYYNCHMIYSNVITDSQYLLNSHYGTVFYDIDNDGKEDKVCLGMGQTSGIFTFTVTVYNGNEIKYNNVFHTEFYYLSFQKNEKGVLQVKGVTQGYPPETHIFDIIIKDGKIDLLER